MAKSKKTADALDAITSGGETGEPEKELTTDERIEALTKSVADLTTSNESLAADQKRSHDLAMNLMSSTPTPGVVGTVQVPAGISQADLDELPDPVENPKGYSKALNDLIVRSVGNQVAGIQADMTDQAKQSQAEGTRRTALWDRFKSQHEDLSGYEGLVSVAAQKAVAEAASKGIDTDKYMFGPGSQGFLDDVAVRVRTEVDAIRKDGEPNPDEKKDDDDGVDTAVGMLPGMPTGGSGSNENADAKVGGSLIAEIKEDQVKTGFF